MAGLKKIRLILAGLFFMLCLMGFLDLYGLLDRQYLVFSTWLQFVPSAFKFFASFSFLSVGFIAVLLLTLLTGRLYCSAVCPLGIMQDIVIFFSRNRRKKRFKFLNAADKTRYLFLLIPAASLIFGNILLLSLLEPYSNFGRIASSLIRPAAVMLNNSAVSMLESFNMYTALPYDSKGAALSAVLFSAGLFVLIVFLSLRFGRVYCNTLCPVGTLLGLFSRFSIFKVSIDKDSCKGCGLCERVCKASCISTKNKQIDFSRCVACYDCLDVCPSEGISLKRQSKTKKIPSDEFADEKRREFISNTFIYAAGASALAFIPGAQEHLSRVAVYRKQYITPPGSGGIEAFLSQCTSCHLCVSSCPTQVLRPSFLEYGITGMLKPRMDYSISFCNYDCALCTEVCPTGALKPLDIINKKLSQLGKAVFIRDNCIVYSKNTECGACSEHCPTKAVNMKPYKNLFAPEVRAEYCIGCGACEYACPVKPHKAIYVEGNYIHARALAPESSKQAQPRKSDTQEDFPF